MGKERKEFRKEERERKKPSGAILHPFSPVLPSIRTTRRKGKKRRGGEKGSPGGRKKKGRREEGHSFSILLLCTTTMYRVACGEKRRVLRGGKKGKRNEGPRFAVATNSACPLSLPAEWGEKKARGRKEGGKGASAIQIVPEDWSGNSPN